MAANTMETNQPNPEQKDGLARLRELTDLLNRASRAYYAQDTEIMSNLEYDALYDQLQALEEETGIVLADSPTVNVGYASVDELPKEAHERPMLSLDKTKDRETRPRHPPPRILRKTTVRNTWPPRRAPPKSRPRSRTPMKPSGLRTSPGRPLP